MAFCGNCGNERKGTEKFCSQCGTPFNRATSNNHIVFNEEKYNSFKKYLPYIIGALVLLVIIGVFASKSINKSNNSQSVTVDSIAMEDTKRKQDIKLITEWYDYVFGKKEISDDVLDKFLSLKIKKSLWTEDYFGCYEFWKFRTTAQDYEPTVGNISIIQDVVVNSEGWYEVRYMDMGNLGVTTIKIENSKIVDFVPDSSWSDNECSDENRVDNSNSISDDSYNSTNTSSTSKSFANEQYVTMYLANQTFTNGSGVDIRIDGSLGMYIDGDYAGVVSVLRYNSTSALLRYGGGAYGEGKIGVSIEDGRLILNDPTDGTTWYQK